MSRFVHIACAAAFLAAIATSSSFAQGAPQTVLLTEINPTTLANGYRASKIIGSSVVNEAGETIGTVDDLIVTTSDKVPYAVLSVGTFLGMGGYLVVVESTSLEVKDKKILLRGGTKERLMALAKYEYSY
jgi:sporulation protein YlmC with PRC-barrel domain